MSILKCSPTASTFLGMIYYESPVLSNTVWMILVFKKACLLQGVATVECSQLSAYFVINVFNLERKRAFKEENRSKIQNTCIQSGIKKENKKVFIQTNDFKKEKSMPLDGIEPRHKIHHVWHSQCFNPLSYPELSHQKYKCRLLWENSVSEFFVFFFCLFCKIWPNDRDAPKMVFYSFEQTYQNI